MSKFDIYCTLQGLLTTACEGIYSSTTAKYMVRGIFQALEEDSRNLLNSSMYADPRTNVGSQLDRADIREIASSLVDRKDSADLKLAIVSLCESSEEKYNHQNTVFKTR